MEMEKKMGGEEIEGNQEHEGGRKGSERRQRGGGGGVVSNPKIDLYREQIPRKKNAQSEEQTRLPACICRSSPKMKLEDIYCKEQSRA